MNKGNQPATKKDLQEVVINLVSRKEFREELRKLVTKKEFKGELKKLVTKKEFREELKKLVTKKEFREELQKLVTRKEFKEEIKRLATKKELRNLRIELVGKMLDLEFKFDKRFEEMDQKFTGKFSQVLTGQDKLMTLLQTWREEQVVQGSQIGEHTERIEVLEKKVGVKASYEL